MSDDTAAPARNFTITTAERVRALAIGVPAYVRRRKEIEDLQRTLADAVQGDRLDPRALARLNALIDRHNRYYPVEANLPLHPRTGALLEGGAPWRPMLPVTIESLRTLHR
jgi:hypothetical protein